MLNHIETEIENNFFQYIIPIKSMCLLQMDVDLGLSCHRFPKIETTFEDFQNELDDTSRSRSDYKSVVFNKLLNKVFPSHHTNLIYGTCQKKMTEYQKAYQHRASHPLTAKPALHTKGDPSHPLTAKPDLGYTKWNPTKPKNTNTRRQPYLPPLTNPPVLNFTQPPVPQFPHLTFTWDFPNDIHCRINLQPIIDTIISIGTLHYSHVISHSKITSRNTHTYSIEDRLQILSRGANQNRHQLGIILWSEALTQNGIKLDTDKQNFLDYIKDAFITYMNSRNTNSRSNYSSNSGSSYSGPIHTPSPPTSPLGGGKSKHIKTTRQNSKGNIIYTKDGKEYVKRLNKKTRKYEFKKTK
jgi:hypothetical protein